MAITEIVYRDRVPSSYIHEVGMPAQLLDAPVYVPFNFPEPPATKPSSGGSWRMSMAELEQRIRGRLPIVDDRRLVQICQKAEAEGKTAPKIWRLRVYQRDSILCDALFQIWSWSRRAAKTITAGLKLTYEGMQKVGTYAWLWPTFEQAKTVLFNGRTATGQSTFDVAIPPSLRKSVNFEKGNITLINGTQIIVRGIEFKKGTRTTGDNWLGCVFSEAATTKNLREIYENHIAPIMSVTGGWVVFEATHNADNDDFDYFRKLAAANSNARDGNGRARYFYSVVTPRDFMTPEQEWRLAAEYKEDLAPLAQHFYQLRGWYSTNRAVCGKGLAKINFERNLATDRYPVFSAWDLGGTCNTAIILYQEVEGELFVVDHIKGNRLTTPNQSTRLYAARAMAKASAISHWDLHYMDHTCETHKSLDHHLTPYVVAKNAGMKVEALRRPSCKLTAIYRFLELLAAGKVRWDEKCAEVVDDLRRVKWKTTSTGVILDTIEPSMANDMFDAAIYMTDTVLPDPYYNVRTAIKRHYAGFCWPDEPVRPPEPIKIDAKFRPQFVRCA